MSKFEIGKLVATKSVAEMMEKNKKFFKFVTDSLEKYINCDWGDTRDEDKEVNNQAVSCGERILAVYKNGVLNVTIWIVTEADRSYTTILFPSEY